MRLVLIFSILLLNSFSYQQVYSQTERTSVEKLLAQEILAKFKKGQEELDYLDKNVGLNQDLVLLIGSSKAKEHFFYHSSEFVNLTSNSMTLPYLTLNTVTKTKFLDFFILDEEGKSAQFIPRVYFTKNIVDSVSAVKLLLLVDFPSFDEQIDVLLQKAGEFIEDVEKFVDSIGLIVTQVQNEQQIEEVKGRLKKLANSPEASNETATIIDALHREDDWAGLGFVEDPSDSSLKGNVRKDLERVIYESIYFENHNGDDFVYSPCKYDSRVCDCLTSLALDNLVEEVDKTVEHVINFYVSIEKQLHDFEKSYLYLTNASEHLSFFIDGLQEQKIRNPKQFIDNMAEYLKNATVDLPSVNFQLCVNYAKYLVFLQGPDVPLPENKITFDRLFDYLESSTKWYGFLLDLDSKILSDFEVQKDISPYKDVALQLIEDIKVVKHKKNNNITKSWNKLVHSLPQSSKDGVSFENLKMAQLEEPKLEVLKNLLSATLNHTVTKVCTPMKDGKSRKLKITGSYVKLSETLMKDKCWDADFVEVFALYKVFIDNPFHRENKKNAHLAIIAPYWEVIPGKSKSKLIYISGKDPKYGGPGGSFLGIVRFIKNPELLRIQVVVGPAFDGRRGNVRVVGLEKPRSFLGTQENEKTIEEFRKILKPLKFDRSINSYRDFLRKHQVGNTRGLLLEKFAEFLADSKDVMDLYTVGGLIDEFQILEHQFWKLNPEISLLQAYRSLLDHIINCAKNLEDSKQLSHDDKSVLRYLYTAALSKIVNLENNVEAYLVVDLNEFWEPIIIEAEKLNNLEKMKRIEGYRNDYLQELNRKVDEAQRYVKDVVAPELDRITGGLNETVSRLVNETIALQKAAEKEKKELIKKQERLKVSLIVSGILKGIQLASMFLNFLGPIGSAVGSVIGGAAALSDSLLDDSPSIDEKTLLKLPGALSKSLSHVSTFVKEKKELLTLQLDSAQRSLTNLTHIDHAHIKDLKDRIKDAKKDLEEELRKGHTYDPASIDKMNTLRKEIKDLKSKKKEASIHEFQKIENSIRAARKELKLEQDKADIYNAASVDKMNSLRKELKAKTQEKIDMLKQIEPHNNVHVANQLKKIAHVQTALDITEASVGVYKQLSEKQEKIDMVGNLIKSAEQKFQQLKQYEDKIYSTIVPLCENVQAGVHQLNEQLEGKSTAALVVTKWQIQNILKGMSKEIKKMTEGFKAMEEFVDIFDKVEDGINVMIELYNTIDEYRYRAELGAYIANINRHTPEEVSMTNDNVTNVKIENLMLLIQKNVAMQNYRIVTNVIKQRLFPFAHDFFASHNLPQILKTNGTNNLTTTVTNEIKSLKIELAKINSTTNPWDTYLQRSVFSSRKNSLNPFYTWTYNKHKYDIEKLLKGEKVVLKADIKHGHKANAVKFNKIGISFTSPNKTIESDLDELLKDYSVTMIHLGISYYKCDNRIYMIASANQTIRYLMDQHVGCAEPATSNMVYGKIASNQPVLSPYATWQIQLSHKEDDFDKLMKYATEMVDLQLEGTGQFVDSNKWCNKQLDQYYARVDDQIDDKITAEIDLNSAIDGLLEGDILQNEYLKKWYADYEN